MAINLVERDGACIVPVYVTPRAGKSEVAGERGGALWVRLAAPPVDGAANKALLDLLTKLLDVPGSAVRLLSGASGRQKRVAVSGLLPDQVRRRLRPYSQAL
jgi:uncharacterized protein (TIGR00251 family)